MAPLTIESSKFGDGSRIELWRDYRGPRLRVRELERLLETEPTEVPFDLSYEEMRGLVFFVALHGEALVRMSRPAPLFQYEQHVALALVDTRLPSACLLPRDPSTSETTLVSYGSEAMLERWRGYLESFRALGRPSASQVRVDIDPVQARARRFGRLPHPQPDGSFRFQRKDVLFTARYQI